MSAAALREEAGRELRDAVALEGIDEAWSERHITRAAELEAAAARIESGEKYVRGLCLPAWAVCS